MRVNYHTHTTRCLHAINTDWDYIQEAIAQGLDVLGFSDHAPFMDYDYGYRMHYNQLDEYLESLTGFKEEFAGKISIMRGLEIEYMEKYDSYYEKVLSDARMDYLLLAGHFFLTRTGEQLNIFFAPDTESYIDYANNLVKGMKTGYFSHIVHPDLMFINQYAWDKNCEKACDIIIDAAAANDWLLEYNANGIRRGVTEFPDGSRYPYPVERFWKEAKKAGVRTIVGSDCHEARQVWDNAVQQAICEVHDMGLKYVTEIK